MIFFHINLFKFAGTTIPVQRRERVFGVNYLDLKPSASVLEQDAGKVT